MKKLTKNTINSIRNDVMDKACGLQKQLQSQLKSFDVAKVYAFLQIPTVQSVKRLEQKVAILEKQLKAKRSKVA